MKPSPRSVSARFRRYLVTGILTIIPLWVTWIVFHLVLTQLSAFGLPAIRGLARLLRPYLPAVSGWLSAPWLQSLLAVVSTIVFLCLLGWGVNKVLGRRALDIFDRMMARIPFITSVYGLVKKFMATVQQKPDQLQRVVLIPFPTPEMKTVGFVTKVLRDRSTGQEIVAVYVPTTPNPTSGYLELVPKDRVIPTDWTIDQAMTFVISGGAVAPPDIDYMAKGSLKDETGATANLTVGERGHPAS